MAWHVRWMREAGVTATLFEFITMHDEDGQFLGPYFSNRALEEAFLGKPELGGPPVTGGPYRDDMDFAIMWTNHPTPRGGDRVSRAAAEYMVTQYMTQPHYLRLDDRPVLFIWNVDELVGQTGSMVAARGYLDELRAIAHRAGV